MTPAVASASAWLSRWCSAMSKPRQRASSPKAQLLAFARGVLAKNDRLDARLIAEYVAIMPTRVVQRDEAVEKLAEAAHNPKNHRYSLSRGLPKLREAIAGYYKNKWDVDLDTELRKLLEDETRGGRG